MNIFLLSLDPRECARFHCDKHIVKMPVEYAQLLFTAARLRGHDALGYKSTHVAHPCTQWAAKSMTNWAWLYCLANYVGAEYTVRYNRVHASSTMLDKLPHSILDEAGHVRNQPIEWVQCVADDCKGDDPVEAYREFYRRHKAHFAAWNYTEQPSWM